MDVWRMGGVEVASVYFGIKDGGRRRLIKRMCYLFTGPIFVNILQRMA
jgi:hypothetical protein